LTVDWYDVETGGEPVEDGQGVTAFTTPEMEGTSTFYAEVRNILTGCVSASRTAFKAESQGAEGLGATSNSTSNTVLYRTNTAETIDDDTFVESTIPEITVKVDSKGQAYTYYWEYKALGDDDFTAIPNSAGSGSSGEDIVFSPRNHDGTADIPTGQAAYDFQNMYLYRCVVTSAGCQVHIPTEGFDVAWGCGTVRDDNTWAVIMCHNLGADETVSPYIFSEATWGDFYQWGRQKDGHEKRNSPTTTTKLPTLTYPGAIPTDGKFVVGTSGWSTQAMTNVWGDYDVDGTTWIKGVNDPCPAGWHILDRNTAEDILINGQWSIDNGIYKAGTWLVGPATGLRELNGSMRGPDASHWWVAPLGIKGAQLYTHHFHLNLDLTILLYTWYGGNAHLYQENLFGLSIRCVK
jgi:hypothetical protein